MDDNKVTSCNANFLDFFFKGICLIWQKFFFFLPGDNFSCTIHILKYVYDFVLFPHHFLAVQQSAFFF